MRDSESMAGSFHSARKQIPLSRGRVAYVDVGEGPPVVFLHGWPLNAFQWRGPIALLSNRRRCIAPDFLGLGFTEACESADLSPVSQAEMIGELMDALGIAQADLVSNDSGTGVAQLIAAYHPDRVRSMLLTNGDVHTNSPPAALLPALDLARHGQLIDWFEMHLRDSAFARSEQGLGGIAFTNPDFFDEELAKAYLWPLTSCELRRGQCQQYGVQFEPNPLPAIQARLRSLPVPARILWGTADSFFPTVWAEWLHCSLPYSRGIRFLEGARLFFPEEFPDLVVEEAERLWSSVW